MDADYKDLLTEGGIEYVKALEELARIASLEGDYEDEVRAIRFRGSFYSVGKLRE